jgi:hypothetical protein
MSRIIRRGHTAPLYKQRRIRRCQRCGSLVLIEPRWVPELKDLGYTSEAPRGLITWLCECGARNKTVWGPA